MKRCFIVAGVFLIVMLMGGAALAEEKTGQGKLNINTATSEEFQLLPGIGEATAKNILEYRKAHGNFKTVPDLAKVKGIGPKKLKKLQPHLKTDGKSDYEPTKAKPDSEKKPMT